MSRRVLITAGAAGIGRQMAGAFAATGAQVWVSDVDDLALSRCPGGWRTGLVDVSDAGSVASLFEAIKAEWGGLDVLCANADTPGPTARVESTNLQGRRHCLSVNLDGAFLCAAGAAPMMKAQA